MTNLPVGWKYAPLKKLGSYVNGRAFKPNEWKTKGLPIIRIQNLNNNQAKFNYSDNKHEERYFVKNGDLLVAWSASLGVFIWDRGNAWLNQHIFRVEVNESIVTKNFLYYGIKEAISDLYTKTHGTGMVHVTKPVFEGHAIPVPPINEQRRIVAKLEKLLQKVDACKERLDKIPTILKRFRQSVLAAACSGRLTEDWRENNPYVETATELLMRIQSEKKKTKKQLIKPHNILEEALFDIPDSWAFCFFEDIAANKPNSLKAGPFGSALTKSCYVTSGYKIYGQEQVIRGDHSYGDYYIDEEKFFALQTCEVKAGDILVSLVGTIGKVLIIPDIFEKGIINPRLIKITLFEEVSRKYIASFLSSTVAMNALRKDSHGGTMEILNMRMLKNLPIPIPPINEQHEIVRRIEALFKVADRIEERYNKARTYTDKLTQSILAKAFRGKLVPQDPTDEPASELLKRIKEEKTKIETKAKTKRGRKSKVQA